MLPQIFRADSPALALKLAPEHQRALENLLAGLHPDSFQASDSLGWGYQFWQTKRKDAVYRSVVKIGAFERAALRKLAQLNLARVIDDLRAPRTSAASGVMPSLSVDSRNSPTLCLHALMADPRSPKSPCW